MKLFKEVTKKQKQDIISELSNVNGDPYLDNKRVPVSKLEIEEEIAEPISLDKFINLIKES